jgi:hypothetical protein
MMWSEVRECSVLITAYLLVKKPPMPRTYPACSYRPRPTINSKELHASSIKLVCLSRNHERLDEVESCALKTAECAHLTGVDTRLVFWRGSISRLERCLGPNPT